MSGHSNFALLATIAALVIFLSIFHFTTQHNNFATHILKSKWVNVPHAISATTLTPVLNISHQDELLYIIDDTQYFSPVTHPVFSFPFSCSSKSMTPQSPTPAMLMRVSAAQAVVNVNDLKSQIEFNLQRDDVLSPGVLHTMLLLPKVDRTNNSGTNTLLDVDSLAMLSEDYKVQVLHVDPTFDLPKGVHLHRLNMKICRFFTPLESTPDVSAPYLASFRHDQALVDLYPVYRLYPDRNRAFLHGLYSTNSYTTPNQRYKAFRHVDALGYNLIPVPSRLYKKDRLNDMDFVMGQRIAVKDIFDINGVPTNAGSRAYGEVYGNANSTAISLQKLEALGAQLVGKTKTYAFAGGSLTTVTINTVDEQYPFSARGDGWQTARGSSCGSAVAMTAYDWLDFAVGSDTGGSIRGPAAVVGMFGNRPTTGMLNLTGVIPLDQYADTAGIFARNPSGFSNILRAWYGNSSVPYKDYSALPGTILAPKEYLAQATPEAQAVVQDFIDALQDKLDVQVDTNSLDRKMDQVGYMSEVLASIREGSIKGEAWWSLENNGKPFRGDYAKEHEGQWPGVDPQARETWDYVDANFTQKDYEGGLERVKGFRKWFEQDVLWYSNVTCSDSIMMLSLGTGGQLQYREDKLNEDMIWPNTSLQAREIAAWTSSADYTIPIGQVRAMSKISRVEEQVPVTINFVAHAGSDFMLLDFVDRLAEAGLIKSVKTGRTAF